MSMTVAGIAADYWTCDTCLHIWTVNRDTGEIIRHVTLLSHDKT
jgi:hypothetical protein